MTFARWIGFMKKLLLVGFSSLLLSSGAYALSTDSSQPIEIHADQFNGDEVKQTAVYSGNVVVDQGSIHLTGTKLTLVVTPKGYRHITLDGAPATFKQKRDNKDPKIDEWVHAKSKQIIYDEETDKVTLAGQAELRRTENGVQKDMTSGERITYDMRNALSEVSGSVVNGTRQRVTTIIAPRKQSSDKSSASTPKQELQPTTTLSEPKGK